MIITLPMLLLMVLFLGGGGISSSSFVFHLAAAANYQCFTTRRELKGAVDEYLTNNCTNVLTKCDVTQTYGWPMNSWCVDNVTDMSLLFGSKYTFNEDISGWKISSVTRTYRMFFDCTLFNGNLSSWDVGSVVNMAGMFLAAHNFNQDLSSWDVSRVEDFTGMFRAARSFNADVSMWTLLGGNATRVDRMFYMAKSFNQNLCAWGDKFPYDGADGIFKDSSCINKTTPHEDLRGPFCASDCRGKSTVPPTDSQTTPAPSHDTGDLAEVGNNGKPSKLFPLGKCHGDCANDEECQVGLACMQRNGGESVPGCAGYDPSSSDYCYDPNQNITGAGKNENAAMASNDAGIVLLLLLGSTTAWAYGLI
eukprot:CAMPEP_0181112070 /NCGR_PEP_ID=MMETSP1071-20121207/19620_1 /TAXON_ID=35127 /ORGANISM="Thalassiosira sp., Strain NH16" /LENGTH=363 /DNA_ID=CAMNT_0023196021 /DNA_START=292 /DNA_END=1383 /DNA_ORIENTATION=+